MPEKEDEQSRWAARQPEQEPRPAFHDDPGLRRSALDELRQYPSFADDDDAIDTVALGAVQEDTGTAALGTVQEDTGDNALPVAATRLASEDAAISGVAEPLSVAADTTPAAAQQFADQDNARPSRPPAVADGNVGASANESLTAAPVFTPSYSPWYSRVPTGTALFLIILYFTIGGAVLIGLGLGLGGIGGTLMALFGLVIASIAAFCAWQELVSGNA